MMRSNQYRPTTATLLATFAALLAMAAPAAHAGSVLDTAYGSTETTLGAEIDGMAGTGAALYRGGFNTVLNPALLGETEGWRLDAGLSLAQDHEDRFQPLWDSFESYVTDTAIASNRNHSFDSGFAVSRRLNEGLAAALALTTLLDFGYDFSEQILNPATNPTDLNDRDLTLEERSVEFDGSLRDLALGTAWNATDEVSLGVTAHYVFGTRTDVMSRRYMVTPEDSYRIESTHEVDGVRGTIGIRAVVSPRLTLGAAWDTPLEVKGDRRIDTTDGEGVTTAEVSEVTIKYPGRVRLGLAYHPRQEPRTVFTADLIFTEWSDLCDSSLDDPLSDNVEGPHLQDVLDARVGVEHMFYNGVPVRFGFRHLDSYADGEASASVFTAGIGIPYADGMFSISAELRKVMSYQEHWYDYPAGYTTAPTARVDETRFRLGAGLTYLF
jgi:hypothetical protein